MRWQTREMPAGWEACASLALHTVSLDRQAVTVKAVPMQHCGAWHAALSELERGVSACMTTPYLLAVSGVVSTPNTISAVHDAYSSAALLGAAPAPALACGARGPRTRRYDVTCP